MSNAKVLAEIQLLAQIEFRIVWTTHALERMAERGANKQDVLKGIRTATSCMWSTEHASWNLTGGVDLEGMEILVAANIGRNLIIRTVI